jgi:O-antigen ligase
MKLIERFLNSGVYIALIFTITLISWSFYQETPPHIFNIYNIIGLFFLVALMFFILVFFENTLYITPILISFLFIINKSNMDLSTTTTVGWVYIALGLIILGPIIHFIRYKPKIKKGHFTLGLLLIAISYIITLLFLPFEIDAVPVSMMGFIYLGFYIFLLSSAKANIDYIFKIMIFANILLTAQVGLYLYRGYIANPDLAFVDRLFAGWGRNLGWANINDMCFYIALTFPSYLYFIYKKPYHMFLWIIMIIPVIFVFLTESRGGLIGFALSFLGIIVFNLLKGHVMQLVQMLIFLTVIGVIFYIYQDAAIKWWDRFILSFGEDLNDFSTGRIEIYKQGLTVFKAHPLFGGGWLSLQQLNPGSRLFMYHSTFVQSLAAMGLFGLFALLVHYVQVITFFFKNITLEKSLFIIGYGAAQIHGLIDNVQYAVPFSLLMVIIFALWEKSEKSTIFDIKDHRYIANQL